MEKRQNSNKTIYIKFHVTAPSDIENDVSLFFLCCANREKKIKCVWMTMILNDYYFVFFLFLLGKEKPEQCLLLKGCKLQKKKKKQNKLFLFIFIFVFDCCDCDKRKTHLQSMQVQANEWFHVERKSVERRIKDSWDCT